MMRYVLIIAMVLVSACAEIPPVQTAVSLNSHPPSAFNVEGRMVVHVSQQGGALGFIWHHDAQSDILQFRSPLGQTLGVLTRDAGGATLLDQAGHVTKAGSIDELMSHWVGWSIPINSLADWIMGAADPHQVYVLRHDGLGNLQMQQLGWTITYLGWRYEQGTNLPNKLSVLGNDLTAKLIVSKWEWE